MGLKRFGHIDLQYHVIDKMEINLMSLFPSGFFSAVGGKDLLHVGGACMLE